MLLSGYTCISVACTLTYIDIDIIVSCITLQYMPTYSCLCLLCTSEPCELQKIFHCYRYPCLTRQPAHLVSLVNWINLLGLYFICVCCLLLFLDFPHLCLFGGSAGDPRADGSCGKITFLDSWAQNSGDWERVAGDIFLGHIYIYFFF